MEPTMTFYTLFLVTILTSTTGGEDAFYYNKISTFDSRAECEQAKLYVMSKYKAPFPGVDMACVKTDEI